MPETRTKTIRALFVHNDWARDKLLALARELTDAQLDHPFEIGPGSLRATLRHLYGAERIWFERWLAREQPRFPQSRTITAIDDLWNAFRNLATARNDFVAGLDHSDLRREIAFTDTAERNRSEPLAELLLHLCNHGFHHRAQALNMLRHLGAKASGLDYLFMKIEQPPVEYEPAVRQQLEAMGVPIRDTLTPPDRLDLPTIKTYYRYGDWAFQRVLAIAIKLSDEQIDHPFEIGTGSLHKTLLHIRDGEQWWYDIWTEGPRRSFDGLPADTPLAELSALFAETVANRNAYLQNLADADLERIATVEARPGLTLSCGIGESMLQLCGHGTHHRAQALNMLRHLGAEVPPLDYYDWLHARDPSEPSNGRAPHGPNTK